MEHKLTVARGLPGSREWKKGRSLSWGIGCVWKVQLYWLLMIMLLIDIEKVKIQSVLLTGRKNCADKQGTLRFNRMNANAGRNMSWNAKFTAVLWGRFQLEGRWKLEGIFCFTWWLVRNIWSHYFLFHLVIVCNIFCSATLVIGRKTCSHRCNRLAKQNCKCISHSHHSVKLKFPKVLKD